MRKSFWFAPVVLIAAPGLAQPMQLGAPPPGLCVFSRSAALGGSQAGRGATQRMRQLANAVLAELAPTRQQLAQESGALQQAQATSPPAQWQRRAADFQQRLQAFTKLDQVRGAQLLRTKEQAEQRIGQSMDPLLASIAAGRKCGVIVDRNTMVAWNPSSDLTAQVVQQLDQRLPAIQFGLAPPDTAKAAN